METGMMKHVRIIGLRFLFAMEGAWPAQLWTLISPCFSANGLPIQHLDILILVEKKGEGESMTPP